MRSLFLIALLLSATLLAESTDATPNATPKEDRLTTLPDDFMHREILPRLADKENFILGSTSKVQLARMRVLQQLSVESLNQFHGYNYLDELEPFLLPKLVRSQNIDEQAAHRAVQEAKKVFRNFSGPLKPGFARLLAESLNPNLGDASLRSLLPRFEELINVAKKEMKEQSKDKPCAEDIEDDSEMDLKVAKILSPTEPMDVLKNIKLAREKIEEEKTMPGFDPDSRMITTLLETDALRIKEAVEQARNEQNLLIAIRLQRVLAIPKCAKIYKEISRPTELGLEEAIIHTMYAEGFETLDVLFQHLASSISKENSKALFLSIPAAPVNEFDESWQKIEKKFRMLTILEKYFTEGNEELMEEIADAINNPFN